MNIRAVLFTLLVSLCLACAARGGGAILVYIKTTDKGVEYSLDKGGVRVDGDPKTPDALEEWLRKAVDWVGASHDPADFGVVADEKTTFATVMDILQRFRTVGVKKFLAWTGPRGAETSMSGTFPEVFISPRRK